MSFDFLSLTVDTTRRMSSRVFTIIILIFLMSARFLPAQNDQTQNQTTASADTITLTVTVTDKNGLPVKDLNVPSFAVTGDKLAWEVLEARQTDDPLTIAIVFDLSSSMGDRGKASKRVRDAADALTRFIGLSHPSNDYCFVAFHDSVFTPTKCFHKSNVTVEILRRVSTLPFQGTGAIYDALQFAVHTVTQQTNSKLAILLLVTDGIDSSSKSTFKETVRLLEQSNVLVYPVHVVADEQSGSALNAEGEGMVKDLATLSGGRLSRRTADSDLAAALERVAVELRSQYLVTVRARNGTQHKCQEFKVKVTQVVDSKQKSLNARARKTLCN